MYALGSLELWAHSKAGTYSDGLQVYQFASILLGTLSMNIDKISM